MGALYVGNNSNSISILKLMWGFRYKYVIICGKKFEVYYIFSIFVGDSAIE